MLFFYTAMRLLNEISYSMHVSSFNSHSHHHYRIFYTKIHFHLYTIYFTGEECQVHEAHWLAFSSRIKSVSQSVISDSLQHYGLQPTRFLYPQDFSSKYSRVGCHFPLQEIFLTQQLNLHLLSPALAGGFFTTSTIGKPFFNLTNIVLSHS